MLLTTVVTVCADDITFVGSAPKSVVVGKRFKIEYIVNARTDGQPTLPEIAGMRILMGPATSIKSQKTNINGVMKSSQSCTFTYTVALDNEGETTIPGASVFVGGKIYTSNPVTIKVLPDDQASSTTQQQGGSTSQRQSSNSTSDITDDRLFMLASVNKTKVYDQEAILLTYKVYSDVDLRNLDNPTPDLKGFNIQEVELPQQPQFELEHYNGRNYSTLIWKQFVLFPQKTGKLEIPAMEYEALVAVQTRRSMDPFDFMFNGGYSYIEVKKKLKTDKIVIDVQELPTNKPAGFSGGVGRFRINSTISSNSFKSNEEFTYKVTVTGDGNMKLMGNPIVEFPSEFDVFDPIITNNYRLTNNGFAGERVYEYLVTPRTAGAYTIPAAKFVYFDTKAGKFNTVESEIYTIEVEKGTPQKSVIGYMHPVKEDGKILATDIRYIKLDDTNDTDGKFYATVLYYLLYVISFAVFVTAVVINRKRIKENSNLAKRKTKKANSVATRRLKNAKVLLRENKKNEFYDEILKAIWGYMSDKLNMPLSQLSKENISSELTRRGCSDMLVDELTSLLNEGEFARYAPGDANETMDKVYRMALDVIGKMENTIKK